MNPALEFNCDWNEEAFRTQYEEVSAAVAEISSEDAILNVFRSWEDLRRNVASWKAVAEIRSRQNMHDVEAAATSVSIAEASPLYEAHDVEIKRALLRSPYRTALESCVGSNTIVRWELDVEAFDPQMSSNIQEQLRLGDRYVALLGRMQCSFRGETHTLAHLAQLQTHPDRELRQSALEAKWASFEAQAEELDRTFEDLVRSRTSMARAVGADKYTTLAYRRLGRVDYGPAEVGALRDEILGSVVPLVSDMVHSQVESLGIETIMPWDENVHNLSTSVPATLPIAQIINGLNVGFSSMHPAIGEFSEMLMNRGLTDLNDRPAKAPGAFCEFLPHVSLPFVFANITGAPSNVTSVAHEMGHAFQNYRSRSRTPLECVIPTNEAGEIHSIAMEFLLWPFFDSIFGEAAEEFRRWHMRTLVGMLPYIAAIDHFQEIVYEHPAVGARERHSMWLEMRARYMPWRQSGEVPTLVRGAEWQAQRHVYRFPFYYIDYGIAMCCALQLWSESRTDYRSAVKKYLQLCDLGGTVSFSQLLVKVGLRSPFERGSLTAAVRNAAVFIGLSRS